MWTIIANNYDVYVTFLCYTPLARRIGAISKHQTLRSMYSD